MRVEHQLQTIREELIKDEFNLPITYINLSYKELIKLKSLHFMESARQLKLKHVLSDAEVNIVYKVCDAVESSLNKYYDGFPSEAYNLLKPAIDQLSCYFDSFGLFNRSPGLRLYRIRKDKFPLTNKKDLFHIPFEERTLVSTQRYSIPGFPCLYLGSSVYTCLEELRTVNNTQQVYISSFKNDRGMKFIDLGYPPRVATVASYKKSDVDSYNALKALYLCWPLVAACSVQVKDDVRPFKPEYIVPQLLLQWVRNSTHFNGIRYFTSRSSSYDRSVHLYQNYVFPVKENKESGYCDNLVEHFTLTDPISLDQFRSNYNRESNEPLYLGRGRKGTIDDSGMKVDYRCTYYSYLEEELEKINHSSLYY
ncbi:RES domain-containing protein [Paenibacillus radicis (ex Xue et al. 2023)]|uniref:RES domain-containing protein n=1 Tax=Paenibacillus radicis (ex Xue et al. 2023) TaxID=2972489 RepID=A0ABT1YTV8_9BACL|nr:RES domain-containing protein [Paenibacillus radicis (ex Xue et al. 2023)]MCR8636609.1 RES domain-containing protein [Paenibacillus radicis (ex Xue et al. 2023)]